MNTLFALTLVGVVLLAVVIAVAIATGRRRKPDPGAWMTSDAAMAEALRKDAEKAAKDRP